MLFPNTLLYLYLAIPVKAKYFVGGIGILALINGISNNPSDNVAHLPFRRNDIWNNFIEILEKKR